jgi:hypothetical protein
MIRAQLVLASAMTALVVMGAPWWLLIPAWSLAIITAIRERL